MSRRALTALVSASVLGLVACEDTAPPGEEGSGGAASTATSAATATGAATSSATGGGAGGTGGAPATALSLSIVGPPAGMAFRRRWVSVEVAVEAPAGAVLSLERDGAVVDSLPVDPAHTGPLHLRLPLGRGATPFRVALAAQDGSMIHEDASLYGGAPLAAALDTMLAVRAGSLARWGAGSPVVEVLKAPADATSVGAGSQALWALDATGHVLQASSAAASFHAVPGASEIVAMAIGGAHALFLRADGGVLSIGANEHGQLGTGDTMSRTDAATIAGLQDIVAVAAGQETSFAVASDGLVYAWGSNDSGQLGVGDEDASPHPKPLVIPSLVDIAGVAAARDHVLVVSREGQLFSWGEGSSGQLGHGSSGILASKSQPVPLSLAERALDVAASGNTSYAVLAKGKLLGWGQNSSGQLGVGDTSARVAPAACLVGDVLAVGPGAVGALALDAKGALFAWGSNGSGQLGQPLPPDGPARSSTPVEVLWP